MFELPAQPSPLDVILHGLMQRYSQRVPEVGRVVECMIDEGIIDHPSQIENDHIAFRTLGVAHLGIASLEKIFLHHGYQRRDAFRFDQKKLNAFWYSPPDPIYPRVFLSELCVDELSPAVQATIRSYTSQITADPVDRLDLHDGSQVDHFLHSPLWKVPSLADFRQLASESEYAAWVIYNRYYLNHFAISVHCLPNGYRTIDQFNEFLRRHHFSLNDAGGVVKISRDGLLKQSSTVAEMVEATFRSQDGKPVIHQIAGSYIEFAERLPLPGCVEQASQALRSRDQRRDGFEVSNADKIFESTYSGQTGLRRSGGQAD